MHAPRNEHYPSGAALLWPVALIAIYVFPVFGWVVLR